MQSTSEGVEQSVQPRAEFTAAVFLVGMVFWRELQIHRAEVIGRVIDFGNIVGSEVGGARIRKECNASVMERLARGGFKPNQVALRGI